jgi:hypothetical protein
VLHVSCVQHVKVDERAHGVLFRLDMFETHNQVMVPNHSWDCDRRGWSLAGKFRELEVKCAFTMHTVHLRCTACTLNAQFGVNGMPLGAEIVHSERSEFPSQAPPTTVTFLQSLV